VADVPHFAWPFRLANGHLVTVEQDTLDDVIQCVRAYMTTPKGARPLSPDFGLIDPTFGPGVEPAALEAELEAAEPRASIEVEAYGPDQGGQQQVNVKVDLAG
jgi:phage baseplate assembly protein W